MIRPLLIALAALAALPAAAEAVGTPPEKALYHEGATKRFLLNGSDWLIRRALVVGQRLFTVSDLGAKSSSLSTLADESFVPFPQPPQQQYPPQPDGAPSPPPNR